MVVNPIFTSDGFIFENLEFEGVEKKIREPIKIGQLGPHTQRASDPDGPPGLTDLVEYA